MGPPLFLTTAHCCLFPTTLSLVQLGFYWKQCRKMIIDALLRTAVLVADLENISRLNHEIPKLTHTQSSFTSVS